MTYWNVLFHLPERPQRMSPPAYCPSCQELPMFTLVHRATLITFSPCFTRPQNAGGRTVGHVAFAPLACSSSALLRLLHVQRQLTIYALCRSSVISLINLRPAQACNFFSLVQITGSVHRYVARCVRVLHSCLAPPESLYQHPR